MTPDKKITNREIREKLREGMTAAYFMQRLEIPSERELLQYMEKYHSPLYKPFKRQIKQNKKQLDKVAMVPSKEEVCSMVPEEEMPSKDDTCPMVPEKEMPSKDDTCPMVPEKEMPSKEESQLKDLLEEEEIASKLLRQLETEHQGYIARRHDKVTQLLELQTSLKSYLKELEKNRYQAREIFAGYETLGNKMHCASLKVSSQKSKLAAIREEIESLKEIEVLFYANGEVEFENFSLDTIERDASLEEKLFNKIICIPEADNLSLKVIRSLIKVVQIVKQLADRKINVVFDETTIEMIFKRLISE